eukprot:6195595-Pleurochrysis_carterae.AAC.2
MNGCKAASYLIFLKEFDAGWTGDVGLLAVDGAVQWGVVAVALDGVEGLVSRLRLVLKSDNCGTAFARQSDHQTRL